MELLRDAGFAVSVLSGVMSDVDRELALDEWLAERECEAAPPLGASRADPTGRRVEFPPHRCMTHRGIPITLHRASTTRRHDAGEEERTEFLGLLEVLLAKSPVDVVICFGGNRLAREARDLVRSRGIITVFPLHNFHYFDRSSFVAEDEVIVPSRFARDYYLGFLGLRCTILPNPIIHGRVAAVRRDTGFITFVNPTVEKGVHAFARIADELGRRRPDIPILVVESRGTEATVAACGLELRERGNVFFMAHTHDPRDFWGVTKVCLMPSLWWESQGLVAVEAMVNGIPVIASDRGALPETLGGAGIVLPLPERITQATRMLPTAEEVAPWVEAVIRLWDDAEFYQDHRRRALAEARRWDPEVLEPQYVEFFRNLKPGSKPAPTIPPGRARAVVLVPYLGEIEPECEQSLRGLERAGVRVVRSGGNSAIDVARNRLASQALHDGAEAILFVDSDIGFDPLDALRLLARPEPVVSGVYAKKGRREFASIFAEGVEEVVFGAHAFGLYPLKYAATGFLRIKAMVLRRLIEELDLPHCNTHWGRGDWPFFQPAVVPQGDGRRHYLGEDWAFSHRLAQIGLTPMADTSIRLWHYGRYGYGWEDVGIEAKRYATLTHRFVGPKEQGGS
jgi:glycosyltransferase involved in cell wall biosynthesis